MNGEERYSCEEGKKVVCRGSAVFPGGGRWTDPQDGRNEIQKEEYDVKSGSLIIRQSNKRLKEARAGLLRSF